MNQRSEQGETATDGATSSGARLVGIDGRALSLEGIAIQGDACAGLARVRLEQRFRNPYTDPLRVTYQFPLPPEGVVSAYAFRIGDRRVVGEVDRVSVARERFEKALIEGRSAALVEQDRSSVFTLEIGNIPPAAEVVAEVVIDQRLRWLEEGAWEWRFPTVIAPRYLGATGRVPDGERITVDVADGTPAIATSLVLTVRDALADGGHPSSPSHPIVASSAPAGTAVTLAEEAGFSLDRDLVIRWGLEGAHVGIGLDTGRPAAGRHAGVGYGLLTITPPLPEDQGPALPRDLIVLMDLSGSMAGGPLDQSRRVVARLIETLTDVDQLELIGFADQPRRWKVGAVSATAAARRQALQWLEKVSAGGGTEMRSGVAEALRPLRAEAQRQVVLITDGEIGFEGEIVGLIAQELPAGCRLHTVGVGPAVNRTLTAEAARAGRGAEIVVGLDEDPLPAVERLLSRLRAPVLIDLEISGPALLDHAPARLPDVHSGAPLLAGLRLRPEGGPLQIAGRLAGKPWEMSMDVAAVSAGCGNPAVVPLYGREAVQDLEMRRAAGESEALDRTIEEIGLDFQIATRLTAWIAVSEEATVDPRQPLRRERIPQSLPRGLSIEGLGLRGPGMFSIARASSGIMAVAHQAVSPRLMARKSSRSAPRRLSHVLQGRIATRSERQLVIEIALDRDLDWDPADVAVVWEGAEQCPAEIDPEGTTRPGQFHAGQVIRLVLHLDRPGEAVTPTGILLTSRHAPLEVRFGP